MWPGLHRSGHQSTRSSTVIPLFRQAPAFVYPTARSKGRADTRQCSCERFWWTRFQGDPRRHLRNMRFISLQGLPERTKHGGRS